MTVQSRIKHAPMYDVIDLTQAECPIYKGAGLALARFEDATLAGLWYIGEAMRALDDSQQAADEAIAAAMAWIANAQGHGEVWLVMCSCYTLCAPRLITLTDASSLAYLARKIGEEATKIL